MLDVSGTYRGAGPKDQPQSEYRMMAINYEGNHPYQIRLTGPAKTVEKYKKGFDEWIKGFK